MKVETHDDFTENSYDSILGTGSILIRITVLQSLEEGNQNNWRRNVRQSNGMVILDDMEYNELGNQNGKKSSVAQTEVMTPWIHQHQGTSTDFIHGKASQTNSIEDPLK